MMNSTNELKALEVGEDINHRLAMVVFKGGVASDVSILTLNFDISVNFFRKLFFLFLFSYSYIVFDDVV